ncbi:MAG: ATP-dependent Clp protease ATP-binding subunit [Acidobacteriota bacterium]
MFEQYTERAKRVLAFAKYEASQMGSDTMQTEHILLGLIREAEDIILKLFNKWNIDPEEVRQEIEMMSTFQKRKSAPVEIAISREAQRVLAYAVEESKNLLHKYVGTEHILLGLLREEQSMAARILSQKGLRVFTLREDIVAFHREKALAKEKEKLPFLTEFSRNLTELALKKKFDPLIGREEELERVIQILSRRTKNNPILLGEPGVGKTAIVEGLACQIVEGDVPLALADKRILALDLSLVVAGTKYRGQFEERLKSIINELIDNDKIILFIDEIHTLIGAGSAEGSLDAANILKPTLSRGEIQCIGATTPREHRKYIEKDRSLGRRFQPVKIQAPSEDQTLQILRGVRGHYETYHGVRYDDESIRAAVFQSSRYITDRFFPDKAIDVIDEAGARVKLRGDATTQRQRKLQRELHLTIDRLDRAIAQKSNEEAVILRDQEKDLQRRIADLNAEGHRRESTVYVHREDVESVISKWTGIPIQTIKEDERLKLLRMEDELRKRIVGQENALTVVSRAIRRSRAGLKSPLRPAGSFMFVGPTGVGKTEVARRLAEYLFGSEKALLRFDMSEYMEKHSVAKLIGSPPGYVGYEEGGVLTERVRRNPYSVILLDEIEKAHQSVYNLLLQVFEDGQATDSFGNVVDFKNTLIIMTSNLGARHIEKRGKLGFRSDARDEQRREIEETVMKEIKYAFNPEFINRLDEIVIFNPLAEEELYQIVRLMIDLLNENLKNSNLKVLAGDDVVRWVLKKTEKERNYGARPLRRAIEKYVEDQISETLIKNGIKSEAIIEVYVDEAEALAFREVGEVQVVQG